MSRLAGVGAALLLCACADGGLQGRIQCEQQGLPSPPGYHEREHPVFPPPDSRVVP